MCCPQNLNRPSKDCSSLFEKGMQDAATCFFCLRDYISMPLIMRPLNFRTVYFPSSGLHAAYQDLQCTNNHYLFCFFVFFFFWPHPSHMDIPGPGIKCMLQCQQHQIPLTHCTGLGWNPHLHSISSCCSWILNLLYHRRDCLSL